MDIQILPTDSCIEAHKLCVISIPLFPYVQVYSLPVQEDGALGDDEHAFRFCRDALKYAFHGAHNISLHYPPDVLVRRQSITQMRYSPKSN